VVLLVAAITADTGLCKLVASLSLTEPCKSCVALADGTMQDQVGCLMLAFGAGTATLLSRRALWDERAIRIERLLTTLPE
jgi:hypothetical protein